MTSIHISYLISNLIYIYSIYLFNYSFLGRKRAVTFPVIGYSVFYIIDCAIYFFFDNSIIFTISSTLLFFLLTLLHARVQVKSFLSTLIISVLIAASETLAVGFIAGLGYFTPELTETDATVATILISRFVFFLLVLFLIVIIRRKKDNAYHIHNVSIYIMPVFSIILMYFILVFSEIMNTTVGNKTYIVLFVPSFLLIGLNILTFYLYDRENTIYNLDKHNNSLNNTISLLQRQYYAEDEIRKRFQVEKHDYKNFLIALKSELVHNNVEHAIDKIDEHIGNISIKPAVSTGLYSLDSIVNYKSETALLYGINIKPKVKLTYMPDISSDDLCVLLGVGLDNAIEYLKEHTNLPQEIVFYVNVSNGLFTIDISNRVEEEPIIKNNLIKSTKNTPGHGFGIESAGLIIKKYNGELMLSCHDKKYHFGGVMHVNKA